MDITPSCRSASGRNDQSARCRRRKDGGQRLHCRAERISLVSAGRAAFDQEPDCYRRDRRASRYGRGFSEVCQQRGLFERKPWGRSESTGGRDLIMKWKPGIDFCERGAASHLAERESEVVTGDGHAGDDRQEWKMASGVPATVPMPMRAGLRSTRT